MGNFVPQRVQNMVIRSYLNEQKLTYLLSATEYAAKDSYIVLKDSLELSQSYREIAFYSIDLLPITRDKRKKILNLAMKNKYILHFALEEIQIKNQEDIFLLEEIFITNLLSLKNKKRPYE
jgi:sporadic carbohydrate cluster protein (TIGR04323 family)